MEIRQLEYFREIATTGSINEAARRLNMSQPPLSYQMKQLEAELNVTLFERTRTGVTLTEAGKLLYERAENLLNFVSSTRQEVAGMLGELKANHIENILALRGDIPEQGAFPLPGNYQYAYQLIEDIRKTAPDVCIGAACYPEGHVECGSKEQDILYLKQKVESGCDFLTTQMFFDNGVLYSFLYRILARNIELPVIAGVMPVTNGRQIARICRLSGTSLPARFRMIVDKFGGNPAAMKQAGIAYATEQIIDLIANGVRGIHVYTMNKPDVAASIAANLSHILGREASGV